jgi:hypothetical protein
VPGAGAGAGGGERRGRGRRPPRRGGAPGLFSCVGSGTRKFLEGAWAAALGPLEARALTAPFGARRAALRGRRGRAGRGRGRAGGAGRAEGPGARAGRGGGAGREDGGGVLEPWSAHRRAPSVRVDRACFGLGAGGLGSVFLGLATMRNLIEADLK